ncbi:hypothetical protein [Flagellimonas sp.]|uniref:hypothetical protein n=1 Tax=Flagellimonas sp. TaxID=2058762 RepID=UPI003F4A7515
MVYLESVSDDLFEVYITVGITSYKQHYLHLWKNQDPAPYISKSFTRHIMEEDLADDNVEHFLVKVGEVVIGIVKIIKNKSLDAYDE